ncbi:MAG: hypothetical protein ACK5CY_05390 [Bacteroidia bacterium]|jgi:hypothetical protein
MKYFVHMVLLLALSSILKAQNNFEVKSLSIKEALDKYSSIDDGGKSLELLSVVSVRLNQKECDPLGMPLMLENKSKKEFKNLALYRWNPMNNCWNKENTPTEVKYGDRTSYSAQITCPGTYAYMNYEKQKEKGLLIELPKGAEIKSVKITQQNPAYSITKNGNDKSTIDIPFGPLVFDAIVSLSYEYEGRLLEENYLAGSLTQTDEIIESGDYRKLTVKPGKSLKLNASTANN